MRKVLWTAVVSLCVACGGADDDPGPGSDLGVEIARPTGTTYTRGTVSFALEVTGDPASVELVVDGARLAGVEPPYEPTWDTTTADEGSHEVTARALRGDESVESEAVTVIVDRTAPTVVRTDPVDGGDASVGHPIQVELSEPILTDTMSNEVASITADGAPVEVSLSLSDDAMTLSIDPSWPALLSALEVTVTDTLTDLAGNPLVPAQLTLRLPYWASLAPDSAPENRGAVYALDAQDRPVVAWMEMNGQGPFVQRWDGATWVDLGRAVPATDGMWLGGLVVDAEDRPIVVSWIGLDGASDIVAARYDASGWELMGGGPLDADPAHETTGASVAVDPAGALVVAWYEGGLASDGLATVQIRRWTGEAFEPIGTPLDARGQGDLRPVVAFAPTGTAWVAWSANDGAGTNDRLNLARWDDAGGAWTIVGDGVGPGGAENPRVADLAMLGDVPAVAWFGYDGISHEAFVSVWDDAAGVGGWRHLGGEALDVDLRSDAFPSDLLEDGRGGLVAMWHERPGQRTMAARWDGAAWSPLGPVINQDRETPSVAGELKLDSRGRIVAAFRETTAGDWNRQKVLFRRYNGGDEAPHGLESFRTETTCAISDPDGLGGAPATLTETGCYADVAARIPADGLIPFDINAPLWSDGAGKRRFLVLPPGGTIGYTPVGAWQMPVGTILMKEFTIGDDVPMETRFLVKRDALVWVGFSYQWNDEGTEGTLLSDVTTTKDWSFTDGSGNAAVHTHEYPSRAQCLRCHNASAEFVLGLQTPQMNRRLDYGLVGGNVDNQLRALGALGAFGDTLPDVEPPEMQRLGNYVDRTRPLEERVRAYLHANCAHCHRPGGERATRDFRFDTPMELTNLCGEVVPGDAASSLVYQRDGARPGMPPLATLATDDYWLGVLAEWIGSIGSCP